MMGLTINEEEYSLITTALDETWINGCRVLMLGDWCRLYGRNVDESESEITIIPYHWNNREKLRNDYNYLNEFYEQALDILHLQLNRLHHVEYSKRYWRILVGPWLFYFLHVIYDRWECIRVATSNYAIGSTRCLVSPDGSLTSSDFSHFAKLIRKDEWNSDIYYEILRNIGFKGVVKVPCEKSLELNRSAKTRFSMFANRVSLFIVEVCKYVFDKVFRKIRFPSALFDFIDHSVFLSNTYLPKKIEFLLKIILEERISRTYYKTISIDRPYDESMRSSLKLGEGFFDFEEFSLNLIRKHIPKAYVENYQILENMGERKFPNHSDFIWTANAMYGNDPFKAWAARQTETGTKLIIGQHGGIYGVSLFNSCQEHEIAISDYFLTWGWNEETSKKTVPFGNVKQFRSRVLSQKDEELVLISANHPRYSTKLQSIPIGPQMLDEYEDHFRFYGSLEPEIRSETIVRNDTREPDWNINERWRDRFPHAKIDDNRKTLFSLIKYSKLVVVSYNSTPYLESFRLNKPTVIFWNIDNWQLNDQSKVFFDRMQSVGIFHKTPESAAHHINDVWEITEDWWYSDKVQYELMNFNHEYNREANLKVRSILGLFSSL